MKRFTETEKWRDPWFVKLSGHAKLLWVYLTDNCDKIGLIHIDFRLVSRDCRLPINEKHITELGDRVQALGNYRYFLPKFIQFQYGDLSPDCNPHKPILKLVQQHNLTRLALAYQYPTGTVQTTLQDKTRQEWTGPEKNGSGTEGSAEGNQIPVPPTTAEPLDPPREILRFLNTQCGRDFRDTETNLGFIRARLAEPGVTADGVKIMIVRQCNRWLRTTQAEYLRPETLFNKTKFDAYYAAKDLPAHETNPRNSAGSPRPPTGAEHRQHGIPAAAQSGNLAEMLAARARRAAASAQDPVATTPPPPQHDQPGSPTHG
jgi:uncharacterized phage protein (TIGR02220 family)